MTDQKTLLQIDSVTKVFPGVRALDKVTFSVLAGEVHGLIGENGAGKSTLMKILAGGIRADSGEILLEGARFAPRRPRDALDAGIVVIHQELSLVPDRSIAENLYLGNLPRNGEPPRRRFLCARRRAVASSARLRPRESFHLLT